MTHERPISETALASRVDALSDESLQRLLGESLLLTRDLALDDLETLAALAELFFDLDRADVAVPLLAHECHYALFFDQSTRTKSSWAGAAARLGAHPVIVDGSTTQVSHGETAMETGTMLGMNAHALGVRHDKILGAGNRFMREMKAGIDRYFEAAGWSRRCPIVNLQCDIDHPTQSLADWLWLRERYPEGLAGRKIAVSWAYSPSYAKPLSVPQGLITLLTRFGAEVVLAHPPGYRLLEPCLDDANAFAEKSGGSFEVVHEMDPAFEDADIVYPKSWGAHDLMLERIDADARGDAEALAGIESRALEKNAEHTDWICDERRMGLAADDALYMHCLPADIGAEVTEGVFDRFRIPLACEAQKKLYAIMACLVAFKVEGLKARLTDCLPGGGG